MEHEIYGMQPKKDTTLWGFVLIIALALTVVYLIDSYAQTYKQQTIEMQTLYQK